MILIFIWIIEDKFIPNYRKLIFNFQPANQWIEREKKMNCKHFQAKMDSIVEPDRMTTFGEITKRAYSGNACEMVQTSKIWIYSKHHDVVSELLTIVLCLNDDNVEVNAYKHEHFIVVCWRFFSKSLTFSIQPHNNKCVYLICPNSRRWQYISLHFYRYQIR